MSWTPEVHFTRLHPINVEMLWTKESSIQQTGVFLVFSAVTETSQPSNFRLKPYWNLELNFLRFIWQPLVGILGRVSCDIMRKICDLLSSRWYWTSDSDFGLMLVNCYGVESYGLVVTEVIHPVERRGLLTNVVEEVRGLGIWGFTKFAYRSKSALTSFIFSLLGALTRYCANPSVTWMWSNPCCQKPYTGSWSPTLSWLTSAHPRPRGTGDHTSRCTPQWPSPHTQTWHHHTCHCHVSTSRVNITCPSHLKQLQLSTPSMSVG